MTITIVRYIVHRTGRRYLMCTLTQAKYGILLNNNDNSKANTINYYIDVNISNSFN